MEMYVLQLLSSLLAFQAIMLHQQQHVLNAQQEPLHVLQQPQLVDQGIITQELTHVLFAQ